MDALEGVRELLPIWVRSGALALGVLPFAASFLATAFGVAASLVGTPGPEGAHWTERARALAPARFVATVAVLAAPALAGVLVAYRENLLLVIPTSVAVLVAAVSAHAGGGVAVHALLRRRSGERLGWFASVRGGIASLLILAPHLVVLVVIAGSVDGDASVANVLAAALGIAAFACACCYAGVPLARWLGVARPNAPRLRAAVERAAARAGVVPRALRTLELPLANAWALPAPRWLVFTQRCVDGLDDAQLEAIAGHELGHLSEPRGVVRVRVAALFALLPVAFLPEAVRAIGPIQALLAACALLAAVAFPVRRLQRRMEERADGVAHRHQAEPGAFANALERLYELNLAPAVSQQRRATHPDLYDRLLAAGVEPGYPRPAPPSRMRLATGIACMAFAFATLGLLLAHPQLALGGLVPDVERNLVTSIAMTGGSRRDLMGLASVYAADRRETAAFAVADGLVAHRPGDHDALALRSALLAQAGSCADAGAELVRALDAAGQRQSPWVNWAAITVESCGRETGNP